MLSKEEEEDSLVNYIKYMHARKFPVDRTQVMMLAWAIVVISFVVAGRSDRPPAGGSLDQRDVKPIVAAWP